MTGCRRMMTLLLLTAGVLCALAGRAAAATPSYVALGDSYAAGDGTRVYYHDGMDCYRSPDAYPPVLARADGYALTFEACSGASTADVIASQLGSLSASTSLVTVQVGGDDAGFATVVKACAVFYFSCQSAIETADSIIEDTLPGLLETAYEDIAARAPNAEIVVVGYPLGFDAAGSRCGLNLLTPANELELNQTIDLLDGVIQSQAAAHGFGFVDPRAAFSTHELCSASPWLNNVTLPLIASFHPDIAGESDFTQLVQAVLSTSRH
jgi:hypothetical protein